MGSKKTEPHNGPSFNGVTPPLETLQGSMPMALEDRKKWARGEETHGKPSAIGGFSPAGPGPRRGC